jgi:GntR family transcriptional regulator, vanillate catabolism transcriptional regulator
MQYSSGRAASGQGYGKLHTIDTVPRASRKPKGGPSPQILRALLRLRELVLTGDLAASKRVTELDLAVRVGVSRTPLRLAMEQLAHEGLLTRRPGGGFEVRQFTVREIRDAIELRGALEATAARFAAERETRPAELAELSSLVQAMDVVVEAPVPSMDAFERYLVANAEFHRRLIVLAQNTWLEGVMARVIALPFASPNAFVESQATSSEAIRVFTVAQAHHRGLVEAIAGRQSGRAEALAREHARLALGYLDTILADRERFKRLPGAALVRV